MLGPGKLHQQSGDKSCLTGLLLCCLVGSLHSLWRVNRQWLGWGLGKRIGKGNWEVVAVLSLVVGLGLVPKAVDGATKASDIEALLAVKASITHHNGFLDQWNRNTDPCEEPWVGVTCSCTAFTLLDLECDKVDAQQEGRVFALKLGSLSSAKEAKFNGTISEEIGMLDQLRFLDLSRNRFHGSLPSSLKRLTELRFLSVSDNNLSGKLPGFLGTLEHLETLLLDTNEFSGPIPDSWCANNWGVNEVSVKDNVRLCGNVPLCLQRDPYRETQKIPSVENTFLRISSSDPRTTCDETPPVCDESKGCGIYTPDTWTSPDRITFHFYEFEDPESNITAYTFTIQLVGDETAMGLVVDNMLIQNGTNLVDTVEVVQHSVIKELQAIRHSIEHKLTGIQLRPGSQYNVIVTAANGAGPPLRHSITSKPVRVDSTRSIRGENIAKRSRNREQVKKWNVPDPEPVDSDANSLSRIEAELQPDAWHEFEIRAIREAGLNTTKIQRQFENSAYFISPFATLCWCLSSLAAWFLV